MDDPHSEDPLPPGWSRGFSKTQKKYYYYHKATETTQWHFPTVSEAKDPTIAKRRAEQATIREQQQQIQQQQQKRLKTTHSTTANSHNSKNKNDFLDLADSTSVAIIVPFRDLHKEQNRAQHLKLFIPHMIQFLNKCKNDGLVSNFHVYIIEQDNNDNLKFNRGKLLNIGFDIAKKRKHDVFIFHDVDLLPGDDLKTWYAKFPKKPIHIARVWNRYSNNPKYFGGIVSFSASDFGRINGYPNNFYGWGGEDDELQRRLERLGIKFDHPRNGTVRDLEDMNVTEKMEFLRSHKEWKCMVKWE